MFKPDEEKKKKKLLKIDKQAKGSAKFSLSLIGAFQTFQKVHTFQFPVFCGRTAPPFLSRTTRELERLV